MMKADTREAMLLRLRHRLRLVVRQAVIARQALQNPESEEDARLQDFWEARYEERLAEIEDLVYIWKGN